MKAFLAITIVAGAATLVAQSDARVPAELLLDRAILSALDDELSGVAAKDHVSRLTQLHRVPASTGFHDAIEYVKERASAYGLSDVHVETHPGDGTTWFGTLHGNRGWRVEGGSLDEVQPQPRRIVSYEDVRLAVADNSESADVTTELVDVGRGSDRRDYAGKDVRGKLVLCDAAPSACHRLAVEELGAAGLVSYNSNQVSAWWRDNADLIRWGHLDARGRRNAFALMISLREARQLQQRLQRGERITLHAVVKARNDDAMPYETLIAEIPGTDRSAAAIAFSCHLDHEKPGANDNASGCAANLEIARTLKRLIDAGRIPPPARTLRFIWPSEMTGTIAHLTGPLAGNQPISESSGVNQLIQAVVHLDMVGGDPFVTKSVLHATRSPWSIASITDDVMETFARYTIDGAMRAAGDGDMSRAIRSNGGSKDAFWADITPYESGSDHWIYQEGAFHIPAIYLRDHPDVYIHTTGDVADNIEPTKIKRSAFIAAASGYYLSRFPDGGQALTALSYANALQRLAEDGRRAVARAAADPREAEILIGQAALREQRRLPSAGRFIHADPARSLDYVAGVADAAKRLLVGIVGAAEAERFAAAGFRMAPPNDDAARVPVRNPAVKGPLDADGDWLKEKAGAAAAALAIAKLPNGSDVTYEIVNFVDGERTVSEIRDAVSAEFDPIDLKLVADYVDVLAKAGAVSFKAR
jgi:aminopeptidase YwaD